VLVRTNVGSNSDLHTRRFLLPSKYRSSLVAESRLDVLCCPMLSACMASRMCGSVVHTSLARMEETGAVEEDLTPVGFHGNTRCSSCGM
jgi:hypothetical protein